MANKNKKIEGIKKIETSNLLRISNKEKFTIFFQNKFTKQVLFVGLITLGLLLVGLFLLRNTNTNNIKTAKASGYAVPEGIYQDAYTYDNGFKDSGAGVTSTGFNHNSSGYYQAASSNATLESECITLPLPSGAIFDGWQFLDFELANRENSGTAQYNMRVTSCDGSTLYAEKQNVGIDADVKSLDIRPAGTNPIKLSFVTTNNTVANGVRIDYWKVVGKTTGATNITISTPVVNADVTTVAGWELPFTVNFNSSGAISHDAKVNVPMQDVNGLGTPSIDDGLAEDAEVDYSDGNGVKPRQPVLLSTTANTNSGIVPVRSSPDNYNTDTSWDLGNLADGNSGSTQFSLSIPYRYFHDRKVAARSYITFGYTPREILGFDTKQSVSATSTQVTVKSLKPGNLSLGTRFIPDGAPEFAPASSVSTDAVNARADNYLFNQAGFDSDREGLIFTINGNTGSCTPIYRGLSIPSIPSYDYTVVSEPTIGSPYNTPVVVELRRYSPAFNAIGAKFDILGSGCIEGQNVVISVTTSVSGPVVDNPTLTSSLLIQNNLTRNFSNSFNRLMYDGVVVNNYDPIGGNSPAKLVKPNEYLGYRLNGSGAGLANQTSVLDHTYSTFTIPNGLSFNGVRTKVYLDNLYKDCGGTALAPNNGSFDFTNPTNSGWKDVNSTWGGNPFSVAPDINNPNSVVPAGCRLLIRKDNDSPLNVNSDKGDFSADLIMQVCDGTFCVQEANNIEIKVNDGKVYTRRASTNYGPTDYVLPGGSLFIADGSYPTILVQAVSSSVQGGTPASLNIIPGNVSYASQKADGRWVLNLFNIRDKVDLNTVTSSIINPANVPPGGNAANIIFHAPNPTLCMAAVDNNDVNCMAWWEVPLNTQPPTSWGELPYPEFSSVGRIPLYNFRLSVNLKADLPGGTPVNFVGEFRGYDIGTGLPNSTIGGNNFYPGYDGYSTTGSGTPITVLDIPGVGVSKIGPTIWPNNNSDLKYQLAIKNTGSAPNNGLYIVDKLPKNGVDNTTYEPQYRKIYTNYNSTQVIVEYSDTPTCYTNIAGATWTAMGTTNNNSEFANGSVTDNDVPQTAVCTRVRLNVPSVVDNIDSNESLRSNFYVFIQNSAINGSNVYNLSQGGATPNGFGQSSVSPVSATPVRTIIDNKVQINGVKTVEIDPTRAGFVKWKLKYQNTSGLDTTGVTNIVDTLPAGLTFDSVELPSPNPNGVSCVPVSCQPVGNILTLQINSISAYDGFANGNDEGEISVWMSIPDAAADGTSYQNCFDITSSAPNTQVQSGICAIVQKSTNFSSVKTQSFSPERGLNGSSNQIIRPDDVITYTINSTNTEASSRYYRVYDQLDVGTNFVPGTLKINNVLQSDSLFTVVSGKDTISYEYPTPINPAGNITVEFQAKVKTGLADNSLVKNNSVLAHCSALGDITSCVPAKSSNEVQSQFQSPTVIIGSDITSSACVPNSGVLGYSTTCTANFVNYKSGTINFTTSPDTGSCTTPAITASDTTASCTFNTTTIGNNIPVTANASGGGTANSGNLNVLTNINPITGADISNSVCSPTSGVVGYATTCTATFSTNKSGTINFTTSPDTGSCTTPAITALATTSSCTFNTTTIGNNIPVTANASGGGTANSGTIIVLSDVVGTLLISADKVTFNPIKTNSKVFGKNDLIMTVNGDSRFTQGGKTAVCNIKTKNFGVADNDASFGYVITQAKLDKATVNTSGTSIILANQGGYSATSSSFEVPYDATNGCSILFPKLNQNQPKWDYEITVERSDGQLFGRGESYFMLFGAIGVVSISV